VLYDFEQMQCGTYGRICKVNVGHWDVPEDCAAFCDKLAPCYDTPGVATMRSVMIGDEDEDCHQVSQYKYTKDKVLDCKLDCAMILNPSSSVGTEEDLATSEDFSEAYAAAMACVLQAEVTTCGEADTLCADEWAQVATFYGTSGTGGEGEDPGAASFWSDESNLETALAAVDVDGGDDDDPGGSCSAGPTASPFAGFLLLLSVLALIAFRTKSPEFAMRTLLAVLALALAVACEDTDEAAPDGASGDPGGDTGEVPLSSCLGLGWKMCLEADGCMVVLAWAGDDACAAALGDPRGTQTFAACRNQVECSTAEVWAEEVADPGDRRYFSEWCDPPGWELIDPPECPPAECSDPHYPGDGQQPDDDCWDPPEHYCSEGASYVEMKACAPNMSVCCHFNDTCVPCGWVGCSYCYDHDIGLETECEDGMEPLGSDDVPECADAPLSVPGDPACPVIDWDAPICPEGS